MASPSNHWKLGLFVVCGVTLGLSALVLFSARSLRTETAQYKSYFDESVQGLETGSPVKFRGVTIGRVSAIDVAPDRRHVAVTSELGVDAIVVGSHTRGVVGRLVTGSVSEHVVRRAPCPVLVVR